MERVMNRTQWITRTAVILALAVTVQLFRLPPPANQVVTGPLVNALLILAAILVGPGAGVLVGCLTPMIAYMFGIMAFAPMVPFIMAANAVLVLVFYMVMRKKEDDKLIRLGLVSVLAVVVASAAKFLVFYITVNYGIKLINFVLPGPAAAVFGVMQLYTALAGGALALLLGKYLSSYLSQTNQE